MIDSCPQLTQQLTMSIESSILSAQCDLQPRAPETPSDYIPCLYTLGATYDALNGKYADSKSALQQVIDWDKSSYLHFLIISLSADVGRTQVELEFRSTAGSYTASPTSDYSGRQTKGFYPSSKKGR